MKYDKLAWLGLVVAMLGSVPSMFSADWSFPFAESSLSGFVKSEKGEPLEGILVRARREGTSFAVTVISDADGKFRFPKLDSGKYVVGTARADGLEPTQAATEVRPSQESHVDLTLGPAKDVALQMTFVDWQLNLPGTPEQVGIIKNNCTLCHLTTVMRFRFDEPGWLKIIRFMRSGGPSFPQWGEAPHASRPGA